jgi:hypothetical protein
MMVPAVPTPLVVQSATMTIPLRIPLDTNVSIAPNVSAIGPESALPKNEPAFKNWCQEQGG